MPTISLRLTDEEHAALKEWAHGAHRSLQREIIFRLFSDLPSHLATEITKAEQRVTEELRTATGINDLVATYETKPITARPDDHFKPDFGSKLK